MKAKRRIAELERLLDNARIRPPLTFDTLTICFSAHTVTVRGQVITVEQDCVSLPLTNDQRLFAHEGWHDVASK